MENFLGCLMELTENSVLDGAENQYSLTALVKRVLFFFVVISHSGSLQTRRSISWGSR